MESKGCSRSSSQVSVYAKGKTQASNISTIDGVAPSTRSVCITFLDRPRLFTAVKDPEDRGRMDLRYDRATFDDFYFRGFRIFFNDREPATDGRTSMATKLSLGWGRAATRSVSRLECSKRFAGRTPHRCRSSSDSRR